MAHGVGELCYNIPERKNQMSEIYDRLMVDMKAAMKVHDMVAVNAMCAGRAARHAQSGWNMV